MNSNLHKAGSSAFQFTDTNKSFGRCLNQSDKEMAVLFGCVSNACHFLCSVYYILKNHNVVWLQRNKIWNIIINIISISVSTLFIIQASLNSYNSDLAERLKYTTVQKIVPSYLEFLWFSWFTCVHFNSFLSFSLSRDLRALLDRRYCTVEASVLLIMESCFCLRISNNCERKFTIRIKLKTNKKK